MSTKGQVVIPASARRVFGIAPGDELTVDVEVLAGQRVIVLRRRAAKDLEAALERGYRWLKAHRQDPVEALHAARRAARAAEQRRRP